MAVFAPLWGCFDYIWHAKLGQPEVGLRILVPFGHGQRWAVVLEHDVFSDNPDVLVLKEVLDRCDITPAYDAARCRWLERAAAYYLCTQGEMWETALAWASSDGKRRFRCLEPAALLALDADLAACFRTKAALSLTTIRQRCAQSAVQWRVLQALQQDLLEETLLELTPATKTATQEKIQLRPSQQQAVEHILHNQQQFKPFLLFGCTGSGKTEVYLQAAQQLVAQGQQILILVPEIGLTPMWISRLQQRFSHISIWHSALSHREKIAMRLQLPQTQVLLGTRSALFLPLQNLGLIVVDEEHDTSFKQHDGVAYSARDMSLLLGQALKIPVVLGSATPSLESWRQVKTGKMACEVLRERVFDHGLVEPEIVDMRGNHALISDTLLTALKTCQERGEQSMLYLNRRGYAPALQCTACGDVPTCHACSLRLTLHRKAGQLRCHACNAVSRVRKNCGVCGEMAYLPLGSGTERLEDDLRAALPDLRIARFDRDVIRHTDDLQQVLADFEAGNIDCLLGTQMLVKGHHFPNVTLVGILNADLGLNMPDFRASERWWQQMTQVFGRTGRGAQKGKVVVQTWSPDAPWFGRLDDSKAESVLDDELSLRQMTQFPPFARWVRIVFSARDVTKASKAAIAFANMLRNWDEVKVSGPMPCALEKLAGRFRFELILRDASRLHLPWKLLPLLQQQRVPSGVRRKVDVDPQDMM
ncbi:MAG: primosomal protein N' [Mariprofundaceae bacterium]|nr:primosomal protein N' [Mariprofundaceae bacterium]